MIDYKSISSILEKYVAEDDRLLVAISGGADSVGLLGVLLQSKINRNRLCLAYVDHGIRKTVDRDLLVVKSLSEKFSLPLTIRRVRAGALAREKRWSVEHAARQLRYDELETVATDQNCAWILTAHTRNDAAETALMRMRNGGPWYEWTTIPVRRGRILRPLIGIDRASLRAWVCAQGLPFYDDETNLDCRFRRNRLRAELAGRPDYWSAELRAKIVAAAGELAEGLVCFRIAAKLLFPVLRGRGEQDKIGLAIYEIFQYFECLTFVPVEVAWAQLAGITNGRLPSALRRQIMDCLRGRSPAAILQLPQGIRLMRTGGLVWLSAVKPSNFAIVLQPGKTEIPELNAICELRVNETAEPVPAGALRLRAELAERELKLRTWRPGDRIQLPLRPTKKVADLLAESHLDPVTRIRTWVLEDEQGIAAVAGFGVAERALPQPGEQRTVWLILNERIIRTS